MYKVFMNDKPIILTDFLPKENKYPIYLFKNLSLHKIFNQLSSNSNKGALILCSNLKKSKELFFKQFNLISAAGGLVLNPKNEILFIFRNGAWDLPKGVIEKGETIKSAAVREVKEECGVLNLKLIKSLATTYHIYFQDELTLKKTHWFLMSSDYDNKLIPQIEEGITKVEFKNEMASIKALENSYNNIKIVYDTYKEGLLF
jgi:hypothetical protein